MVPAVPEPDMGAFWNARARENAEYFVENRLDYENPDLDVFWASGVEAVDHFVDDLGLEISAEDEIVEIGCGVGRITRVLAARGASVRALDVSSEMLERAREHNPGLAGVTWVQGDGYGLTGVEDGSADGVFSHVVFQHIPDPEITYGYIAEIGRVLRPGGWAAFQVSNDPGIHDHRPSLRHRVAAALGRRPKGSGHPAWRGSAIDMAKLRATADGAGLDVERVTGEGTQYCLVRLRRR
jgi:SAM-dependent methyltransferase